LTATSTSSSTAVPARRTGPLHHPCAQRINGHVALVDGPVDHADRVLLLERHVKSLAELHGIVAACVEQSTPAGLPALWPAARSLYELADIARQTNTLRPTV